ncbi:MAG: amidohydrolase [Chloroflexota bacterium]
MSTKQIYINANVITMNPDAPNAEAIGVSGDTLTVVGSNSEVQQWGGDDAEVFDIGGETMIPGLIESHNHISIGAVWISYANCSSVKCSTIEDVQNAIEAVVKEKEPGEWVQGYGYDDTAIADMRHMTYEDLDAISTDHPIFISHVSGHLSYLNSKALELAGITAETPNPPGGTIDKREDGEPSGLLLETASFLVRKLLPQPTQDEFTEMLRQQIAEYNAVGLTGTHDAAIGMMGDGAMMFNACRKLEQENDLNIRIYTAIVDEAYNRYDALGVAKGTGSNYYKLGGVKFFQDGSIQGFTGALIDDYHTRPGWKGEFIYPQEEFNEKIAYHHKNNDHIVVHCNGDRAIESVLEAMEKAQAEYHREDHRHMLIHAQMANQDQIERITKLGAIPSYFINHIYFWGDRHKAIFLGPERAARMEPLQSSLKEGMIFSVHSDYPITPFEPWRTMHTCVNRETRNGEILGPEECISAYEALVTFTTHAAMCSFEEDIKGSLEVGKLADFVVIDRDMLAVDPMEIKDIQVLRTVIGGRTVYEREG